MRDIDIRIKLKESILKKHYADSDCRVVEELNVCFGDARVDIAVINGSLHGFEIKSDSDTLLRLPHQIDVYSKIFDYVTVVCGEKHVNNVITIVPDWCGIIKAAETKGSSDLDLQIIREDQRNHTISKYNLAQLLWKNEVLDILYSMGAKKSLGNKPKPFLWDTITNLFSEETLSDLVRSKLKSRVNWRSV